MDRQHSYYSVSHIAGLIKAERIDIPCDLKLTLFIAEGEQDTVHAPHLRIVPIPLLSSARATSRLKTLQLILLWSLPFGVVKQFLLAIISLSSLRVSLLGKT